jgi:pyridoxal phosphate enzyme (YggS family)
MSLQASDPTTALLQLRQRIERAALPGVDAGAALLAASKTQPDTAVRMLAAAGQRRFGENYVQEAIAKQGRLRDLDLEWHLIGPLQSNKCALAARHFDWIHGIDRPKLIPLLAQARIDVARPLNLLLQVNIDDEDSKSGCRPEAIEGLARDVEREASLRLRGLMAIPAPWPEFERRREAFHRMRMLFEQLQRHHPGIDTLSIGMSEDFELALQEGATLVRIGSALFGPRPARRPDSTAADSGPQ